MVEIEVIGKSISLLSTIASTFFAENSILFTLFFEFGHSEVLSEASKKLLP